MIITRTPGGLTAGLFCFRRFFQPVAVTATWAIVVRSHCPDNALLCG